MRGSDKSRAILNTNTQVKKTTIKILIIYNIITIFLYWYFKASPAFYFFSTLLEFLSVYLIFKICAPLIVKENGVNRLVKIVSTRSSGLVSFYWDALFYIILIKLLFIQNWKWIILSFGIPVSFFIEIFYKPYKKLKGNVE